MIDMNQTPYLAMSNQSEKKTYRFDYMPLFGKNDAINAITMYQMGDLCAKPGFCCGQHIQHYHEVCYIESGSGQFNVNGKRFRVTAGDLVLVRCNDTHEMMADDQNAMRVFYFEFFIKHEACTRPPYSDILFVLESAGDGRNICHNYTEIESVFAGIFRELDRQDKFCGTYMETYSMQLLLNVCRAFAIDHACDEMNEERSGSLAVDVSRYIDYHVEEISDLSQLSKVFHYSYSHIASVFRDEMQVSLFQYYDQKRFEKAVKFLCEGNMQVNKVAERLHYQSVSAFSKAFAKRFGLSPSKYVDSYWDRLEYTPLFDQGKMLISKESRQDVLIGGNVFYCAGSYVRAIEAGPTNVESVMNPCHRAGAVFNDLDDSVFD